MSYLLHLLLNIRACFPNPVIISILFLGNHKYTLFFKCGVKSKNAHQYEIWWDTDNENQSVIKIIILITKDIKAYLNNMNMIENHGLIKKKYSVSHRHKK